MIPLTGSSRGHKLLYSHRKPMAITRRWECGGRRQEGGMTKGHKETFGDDGCVYRVVVLVAS